MELKELIKRYESAMGLVYRSVNNVLKERVHSDITADQFSVLHYILTHKNCTSTNIANTFGIGKSAVTALVNRLYEKNLLERVRDDQDRRVVYLHVTERGRELVSYTENQLHEYSESHLSAFSEEEISTFIHSLEKLARLMSKT